MNWRFKKKFYGRKKGLNLVSIRNFLQNSYYRIPYTLFDGYYKAVYITGDYNVLYSKIENPFPDALTAQKPNRRFALHFSGGFDSTLLAKFYDSEEVDYIHIKGPETQKARLLAASLKGSLHEIELTPEEYIKTADEIIPLLREPYPYNDVVFAYIASRKAKSLGHELIVTGDGGDVVFGGFTVGPDSALACDIWKTLEPNLLLGLETLQPLMHTVLIEWSKATLSFDEVTMSKKFLRKYLEELNMPKEIIEQKKIPWAGSIGMRNNEKVTSYMKNIVEESTYSWIKHFEFHAKPKTDLLFRQYSLTKWLEKNYKQRIEGSEIKELLKKINELDRAEILQRKKISLQETRNAVKQLIPAPALNVVQKFRRFM